MRITFFVIVLLMMKYNCYSQSISGFVHSNKVPLEYVSIHFKKSKKFLYSDKTGKFVINNFNANDTLVISAIGYVSKEIPLFKETENLMIELESTSQVLNEVLISINNNEKSKWQKINKKTKKSFDTTYEGLPEGYSIVSTYTIDQEIKINGIRLFIMINTLNRDGKTLNKDFNKTIRPILIINSENLEDNYFLNKTIALNNDVKMFSKLDIEFKNTIHLMPNEKLTIGLELIPEDLEKPNMNNVMGVLTTEYLLLKSKTILSNLFSKDQSNLCDGQLNQDLYFELKVVK